MVVIREQTEGEYSALEHESIPGVVECLKVHNAMQNIYRDGQMSGTPQVA